MKNVTPGIARMLPSGDDSSSRPWRQCMGFIRRSWDILYDAAMGWIDDEAMTRGAAIAFYTIFPLAPFVILVTAVAGLAIGREAAQGALMDEIGQLIGRAAAMTLPSLATSASDTRAGAVGRLFGISSILVGATP